MTPIGKALEYATYTLKIKGLGPIWNLASATFAWNAKGTALAVIRAAGPTWTKIESRILRNRGIPVVIL